MPRFSTTSLERLYTCDHRLQLVFLEVIKYFDCTILEGHRGKERQDLLYYQGKTKVKFPNSKHNLKPSKAVDVIPYPIRWPNPKPQTDSDWKKREQDIIRFYAFGGFVLGVASQMGIKLRWGGDWDGDWDFKDQNFDDLVHFELVE